MEDQIKLFTARSRRKIKYFCQLYIIFIVFAIVFIYLLSGGDVKEYRDYYICFGALAGILGLALLLMLFLSKRGLEKEKKKFSYEELSRINREAAKGPVLEHILITSDVIGYHVGIRTVLIPVRDIIWVRKSQVVHANIYQAGRIFMPMGATDRFIDIRTRDGSVHHIPNNVKGALEQEIYLYLLFTVRMRRPGIVIGMEEKWAKTTRGGYRF